MRYFCKICVFFLQKKEATTIFEIGKIIHYDFSDELVELKKYGNAISHEKEAEEKLPDNSAEFWKNKCLNLLEKYNALLENTSTKI